MIQSQIQQLQTQQPPAGPYATEVPQASLDWQKLVALGVSPMAAQEICAGLQAKTLMERYRRQLMRAGVPRSEAQTIAVAIARYDIKGLVPTPQERTILWCYCLSICRTNLWRSNMLLDGGVPEKILD